MESCDTCIAADLRRDHGAPERWRSDREVGLFDRWQRGLTIEDTRAWMTGRHGSIVHPNRARPSPKIKNCANVSTVSTKYPDRLCM